MRKITFDDITRSKEIMERKLLGSMDRELIKNEIIKHYTYSSEYKVQQYGENIYDEAEMRYEINVVLGKTGLMNKEGHLSADISKLRKEIWEEISED